MILEVPDEYREAFIGFLELGLTWLDLDEQKAASKGMSPVSYPDDELAVIEIVQDFIEREEKNTM